MPSKVKGKSVFENRKNGLENFDFHSLTEKCGLQMKNLAVNDEQISQSRSRAANSAAAMCAKLTGAGRRGSARASAQRAPPGFVAERMVNADFAACAKMEQNKWLAARNRPRPKQEFPFKEKMKREDIVKHFRAAADRYADSVLRLRDSQMNAKKRAVPLEGLTEKELFKGTIEVTDSSGYGTGISSSDIGTGSSLFQRNSAPNLGRKPNVVSVGKKRNGIDSGLGIPKFKDTIRSIPKTHVSSHKVHYKKNDIKMNNGKDEIKVILPPKSSVYSPKSSQSSVEIMETSNHPVNRWQTWEKSFQNICQRHELFLKECDRILPPSKSEIGSKSPRKLSQMEKDSSNSVISTVKVNEHNEPHCLLPIEKNSLFENALSRQKMIPQYETNVLESTDSNINIYAVENNSTVSLFSLSSKSSGQKQSEYENEEYSDQKSNISFIKVEPRKNEQHNTSKITLRNKLAEDVFSWKLLQKQKKKFSPNDFRCVCEEVPEPKPFMNLKFPSDFDKQEYQNTSTDNSMPPIKLQKSTIQEVQVPNKDMERQAITENKVAENIKNEDNSSNKKPTVKENLFQTFLKEKNPQNFKNLKFTKIKGKIVEGNSLASGDGVDLRLRRIPDATQGKSNGMNFRVPATKLTDKHFPTFPTKPICVLNPNHRNTLHELTVKN